MVKEFPGKFAEKIYIYKLCFFFSFLARVARPQVSCVLSIVGTAEGDNIHGSLATFPLQLASFVKSNKKYHLYD